MTWDKESVRELRQRLGLSQVEMAQTLGCRQQTISEWELGMYAPANAYGKLLDDLAARSRFSYHHMPHQKSEVHQKLEESKPLVEVSGPSLEIGASRGPYSSSPSFDPAID